jgi:hypothetical protein
VTDRTNRTGGSGKPTGGDGVRQERSDAVPPQWRVGVDTPVGGSDTRLLTTEEAVASIEAVSPEQPTAVSIDTEDGAPAVVVSVGPGGCTVSAMRDGDWWDLSRGRDDDEVVLMIGDQETPVPRRTVVDRETALDAASGALAEQWDDVRGAQWRRQE